MEKNILIFLLICKTSFLFSQVSELTITDLKPIIEENKFPEIQYRKNTKVEEKINTFLQLEHLEHLPRVYKKNPFEKVTYNEKNCCGYTNFYEWKKNYSPTNILSIIINGEASGAYPEEFKVYHNFDLRTGNQIFLKNIFTVNGLNEITKVLNHKVKSRIENYLTEINDSIGIDNLNKEEKDRFEEQISMYKYCLEGIEDNGIDYYKYFFNKDSITFVRGRCSNHAMRAIDDLYNFNNSFSYNEIEKHLSKYGVDLLSGKNASTNTSLPEGKLYKGKINGKCPITAIINEINNDGSMSMLYWYDKVKIPIEWRGNFINGHFSLKEDDSHSEDSKKWIPIASIEANWINNKMIIGTWTKYKTNEVFNLELNEY
jgi:hypothetical protein